MSFLPPSTSFLVVARVQCFSPENSSSLGISMEYVETNRPTCLLPRFSLHLYEYHLTSIDVCVCSKELTISILARAIEHGAATSDVASPTVLEPLIEHSYHVVSAANPSCTTTNSTAVRLLQHALTLLRDPASVGAAAPAGAEAAARLRLRRRAVHALATALHQSNRVSEPLALHRRALAHALHNAGDAESAATLEPRVHIAALSVVRLYMLSEAGAEDLARVADRPDCCEGSWKTLYGRGRPGQLNRFFQPVVERDNSAEINNITVRCPCSYSDTIPL